MLLPLVTMSIMPSQISDAECVFLFPKAEMPRTLNCIKNLNKTIYLKGTKKQCKELWTSMPFQPGNIFSKGMCFPLLSLFFCGLHCHLLNVFWQAVYFGLQFCDLCAASLCLQNPTNISMNVRCRNPHGKTFCCISDTGSFHFK